MQTLKLFALSIILFCLTEYSLLFPIETTLFNSKNKYLLVMNFRKQPRAQTVVRNYKEIRIFDIKLNIVTRTRIRSKANNKKSIRHTIEPTHRNSNNI